MIFFSQIQKGPGAHPVCYTMDAGSFPLVKQPRSGVDQSLPPSVEVEERVELYIYYPSEASWPVLG
jgi:hypothetical protein